MEIITRAEWGARFENGVTSAPMPAPEVWLHHSVTASAGPGATLEQDAATVRSLESIGESRFGYGISYTWLVCKSGRIFEGHSPNRQGTHTGGRNDRARAICLIGNYETDQPTDAQLVSAAALLHYAKTKGWIQNARLNGGHRDVKSTACPGKNAYAKISTINSLAAGSPVQPPKEEDMAFTPKEFWDEYFLRKTGQTSEDGTHAYNVLDTEVGNNKAHWANRNLLAAIAEQQVMMNQALGQIIELLKPSQGTSVGETADSEGDQG